MNIIDCLIRLAQGWTHFEIFLFKVGTFDNQVDLIQWYDFQHFYSTFQMVIIDIDFTKELLVFRFLLTFNDTNNLLWEY